MQNSTIKIYDFQEDRFKGTYIGHQNLSKLVFGGFFNRRGKDCIFISSETGNLEIWEIGNQNIRETITGFSDGIAVDVDPSGMFAATGGGESNRIYKIYKYN